MNAAARLAFDARVSVIARRPARAVAAFVLFLLLCACGGTDGDAPVQVRPQAIAFDMTVVNGVPGISPGDVTVKGTDGIFRTGAIQPGGGYSVKLDQLEGPYAVALRGFDENGGAADLVALATGPGHLNVTPLTTLAVAQLTGRDPSAFFEGLSGTGDASLSTVTEAALADAQAQVRSLLKSRYGIALPDTLGDFFGAAFTAAAGDPMYDAIASLNATLQASGANVHGVAAQIAEQALLCRTERLAIGQGGVARDFCPATKSTVRDAIDTTIVEYAFTDAAGAVLAVRAREADVLSVSLAEAGGTPSYACSGAGCAGLAVGAPNADQSRDLVFANLPLVGATGGVTLGGTAKGLKPGPFFPPLACPDRYQIAYADGRVDSACAAADTSIGAGIGDASLVGGSRRGYRFQTDASIEPLAANLQLRAEGQQPISVFVQDRDLATNEVRGLYKCSGAACAGVTIGEARDDPDTFPPFVLRRRLVTLQDVQLAAVNADGTPSATLGPATVRATLDSFEILFPDGFFGTQDACASPSYRLAATLAYGSAEICPPTIAPPDGAALNPFLNTTVLDDGTTRVFIGPSVGGNPGGGVQLDIVGDTVSSATFTEFNGATYRCVGAACAGIVVGPADGAGERAITFTGVAMGEIEEADLPGDRTATLDGAFTAPAPVPPTP